MMLNKKFNQSMLFYIKNSPYAFKTKLSCEINKSKTGKGKNIVSFKSSLKKIEKDKFKNIPKNEKLMNFPVLDNNPNNNNNFIFRKPSQRKTSFMNSLSHKINFGDEGNIQKKVNENNHRVSSIIPVSRNRNNCSKMKTIKENDDLVYDMLKKNGHCKKKSTKLNVTYFNDKFNKNSKKHIDNGYYSSNTLIKMKKKKSLYSSKLTEIDNHNHTRNISSSMPKSPKKEIREINHSNKESNKNIKSKRSSKKKDYNIRESKTSEHKKDKNNIKERKENEFKKDSNTKSDKCLDIRESKISNKKHKNINDNKNDKNDKNEKNEKNNELKNGIDINNVKTKTEYDIENCTIKEKKKKYYGFPFCCLTQNDDNSSDNE